MVYFMLGDTQLGLLGGLAFALLYSTLAIPRARPADRTSWTWVITLSIVIWSGFTALCGVASSFAPLFGLDGVAARYDDKAVHYAMSGRLVL